MDDGLKRRLIGASVLVSLVVIFVPMLLQREPVLEQSIEHSNIPPRPSRDFQSQLIPLEMEQLALPPEQIVRPRIEPAPQPPAPPPPRSTAVETSKPAPPEKLPQAVPESTTPPPGLSAWMIQVGSFSNQQNAQNVVTRLRKSAFTADIERASVGGRTMYRVLVGPELDRARAESTLKSLNKELKSLKLEGRLKRYP